MARRRREERQAEKIKRAYYRSNTTLLLFSVMLFQFTALLVLSLKTNPIDLQALVLSVAVPAVTYLVTVLFSRLWPIDRATLIMTLLLCSVGLVTLQDIAKSNTTPLTQAVYIVVGLFAMAAAILFIRWVTEYGKWARIFAVLAVLALLAPLAVGEWKYGAKNWINIPGINVSIQPSEFVKVALIFILAAGLANRPRFRSYVPWLGLAAGMLVILLVERDLGALLIYFMTTICLYYAATSNLWVTLMGLGAGAGSAVVAYHMFDYVAKRVEMFLNPWSDPLDKGWQIIQALIAIGSGGAFGMGLGLGYPRNIPLYHSDFIFAAIGEEFGLIFALGVLAIYLLIILRGVTISMNARTSFHGLTAFGVVVLLGVQTFIHVGGNIKLIPLTGVTLPFISSGGSSMVAMMAAMGVLLGISSITAKDEADDLKRMEWREVDEEA